MLQKYADCISILKVMVTQTTIAKETLGERIKYLMELRGLTKIDLSRETGVPEATLGYLVDGSTYNPRIATLLPIAKYFEVSLDYLIKGIKEQRKLPVLSWDNVILWCKNEHQFVEDVNSKWICSNQEVSKKAFALIVSEEVDVIFSRNSIIVIDPAASENSSDFVLVSIAGEKPSIKKIICENDKKLLKSIGSSNFSVEVSASNIIIGKIIEHRTLFTENV